MRRTLAAAMTIAALTLTLTLTGAGCENPSGRYVQHTSEISECGGFHDWSAPGVKSNTDYCAAEMLHWHYNPETGKLAIADTRAFLNCCGTHSISVREKEGVYVVKETDAPDGMGGRCGCMCVFDFETEFSVEVDAQALLPLRIVRDVTDDSQGEEVLFDGTLDLNQGAGSEVLDDTDIGMWCQPAHY